MMRRWAKPLFLAVFVLAMFARVIRIFMPALHHPHAHESTERASEVQYAQGDVVRVDPSRGELVLHPLIQSDAAPVAFHLQQGVTHIRFGTSELKAEDIQPGDHATVSFKKLTENAPPLATEVKLARSMPKGS